MLEGGVLKLSHLYMFSRQRTNGTIAAPPVGVIYTAKLMFRWISIQHPAYYQTAENCFSRFSHFSAWGDQTWGKTQKWQFVGFEWNILSPHQARRRGLEFGVFDQTPLKMVSAARPYGPRHSIFFPPQNYNSQSIGSALRASPFASFGTSKSTPAHIRTGRRSRCRPPITIEVK